MEDNAGTVTKYINGNGIDNKLRAQTGTTVNYFLADHLGSTNGLADNSGSVTSTISYDSFGIPSNSSFTSRHQFTGREFDTFTGLQFFRARWYDPKIGRFISEDPIGFNGGDLNLFAYVWNSPHNYRDPTGLYPYKLPASPGPNGSNLPDGWRRIQEHTDPTKPGLERYVSPGGEEGVEFHPARKANLDGEERIIGIS